jgi:hypothetical protein
MNFGFDNVHIFKLFYESYEICCSTEFSIKTFHIRLTFENLFELAILEFKSF